MTRRDAAIVNAAIREIRRLASIQGKRGNTARQDQLSKRADAIAKLVAYVPAKGCNGCAYEAEKAGRCVDCARVPNRTDNFRRKFV